MPLFLLRVLLMLLCYSSVGLFWHNYRRWHVLVANRVLLIQECAVLLYFNITCLYIFRLMLYFSPMKLRF